MSVEIYFLNASITRAFNGDRDNKQTEAAVQKLKDANNETKRGSYYFQCNNYIDQVNQMILVCY